MPEPESQLDIRIRQAAFRHVLALREVHKALTWQQIERGFQFAGETIRLATKAAGIFKPKQMETLLSIKTVVPRKGRKHWYDDQLQVQRNFFRDVESFEYSLMKGGLLAAGNRWIVRACEQRLPIIYFLGIAPGLYEPIVPAFIYQLDPDRGVCFVGPGQSVAAGAGVAKQMPFESTAERRYYMRQTQQRAHQSIFRAAVLKAYDGRCAVTGLPVAPLIDAAQIIEDRDEELGQPVVPNGLPLSKIHHSAFDADLIGIDPDYRIRVSVRLLDESDGPMLELLKGAEGNRIHLPPRSADYPDPERLERRFERFKELG